jgi:hypothetical protein
VVLLVADGPHLGEPHVAEGALLGREGLGSVGWWWVGGHAALLCSVGVSVAGRTVVGVPEYERRVPADPVPVDVEYEGDWWPGTLREWARWDSVGWRGLCTWSVAPGSRFHKWVPEAQVRPRE